MLPTVILAAALLLGASESVGARQLPGAPAAAAEPNAEPPVTMRIGARVQVRYGYDDSDGSHAVHIRRARLSLGGKAYEHFDYAIQIGLAGAGARLLDANVRYAPSPLVTLWFGQGKAFFGRQQLNSSGNLHFADRSIVDGRFSAGRQQGIAVLGRLGGDRLEYSAGVYNGDGINRSANDGGYMTVGRLVWTPLGAYPASESAHDAPTSPRVALGLSGLRNRRIEGTGTVEVERANLEAAFKLRGLNMTAELYRERAGPQGEDGGVVDGGYYQVGYLLPGLRHELAARYAIIRPDTPNTDETETGIGYSYYFRGHRAKVQADLRNVRAQSTDTDGRELRVQLQLSL